jgi:hypothetical protein
MQDEDGDDSIDGVPKDNESDGHGACIAFAFRPCLQSMFFLLVMCAKRPPEDYEPDTDDTAQEGHQGSTPTAVKPPVQRKRSLKAKPTSKTRRRRKRSVSECEGALTGECTIEVLQDDKLHIVNRKQKLVKQPSLRFGPFEFREDMAWETFLDHIAEACEATRDGLVISSLCWRWMKPANSSPVPLCNNAGFASLKKKLTGTQPMIILIMKPPHAVASQKPVCDLLFRKHH